MSTLREAAQQALLALEFAYGFDIPHLDEHLDALDDLRAALAEPYTDDITQAIQESGMTFHLGMPHAEVIEQLSRFADAIKAEATIKAASMAASVISETQRKPLTDEEILSDEVLRYNFGCNGGAGPVSQKGIKIVRAIERAHGIGGEA